MEKIKRRNSFISKIKSENRKIAGRAEYRLDEHLQNLLIFGISIVFQMEKILKIR